MVKSDQNLRGLGGWLILLAVGLIGTPGNLLTHAERAARQFQVPGMATLLTPGSAAYDPRWQALVTVETSATALASIPAILLIGLFFLRHRSFPIGYSLFACYMMSLLVVRAYLVLSIPSTSDAYRDTVLWPTILALAFLSTWITYLFRSRRVRLTFTRRCYPTPHFPYFMTA